MELESSILYQILNQFDSQLMQICNSLVGKSEEQLKQFWLVKQAAKSPSIYQLICDKLMKNHASFKYQYKMSTKNQYGQSDILVYPESTSLFFKLFTLLFAAIWFHLNNVPNLCFYSKNCLQLQICFVKIRKGSWNRPVDCLIANFFNLADT